MSVFCLNKAYFPRSFCSRNISNGILVSLDGKKTVVTSLRIIRLGAFIFYNLNSEFIGYLYIQTCLEIRSSSMIDCSKNVSILQL